MVKFKYLLLYLASIFVNIIEGKNMSNYERRVQICPVGFEYERVIEGVNKYPSNVIYLLKSYKRLDNANQSTKKMIKIAETFVNSLKEHFESTKICSPVIVKTNITKLEDMIKELCKIIKEELEKDVSQIFINISTANKLFVSAAMYVGSFFPEKIKLFYLSASDYIINDLIYDEIKSIPEFIAKFNEKGMTYKRNENSYEIVKVPTYPIDLNLLKENKKKILKSIRELSESSNNEWVTLMKILGRIQKDDPHDKKIKMRYNNHFKYLRQRGYIDEKIPIKEKHYKLTKQGDILALILTYLG